jgi:hypothetical protein
MSYVSAVAILLLVVSPLLIPLSVSGVHAIANWRRNYALLGASIGPNSRAITPAN